MKYSKVTKAATVVALLLFILSFRYKTTEEIEVYFSDSFNISNLSAIQSDLAEKNIQLNYDYLKFNSDGKLKEIKYRVWYKEVGGGDETTDAHNSIGFIIDTNTNPKYGIIGEKDKIQKRRMDLESKK
ncbi:MAG: hypothetical protein ACTHOB_01730 [Ginsengibacter sp.]